MSEDDPEPRRNRTWPIILAVLTTATASLKVCRSIEGCRSDEPMRISIPRTPSPYPAFPNGEAGEPAATIQPKTPPEPEDPRADRWFGIATALLRSQVLKPLQKDEVKLLFEGLAVGDPNAGLAFCTLIDFSHDKKSPLRAHAKQVVNDGLAKERKALKPILVEKEPNPLIAAGEEAAERRDCENALDALDSFENDTNEFLQMAAKAGMVPKEDPNTPKVRNERRRQFFFGLFNVRNQIR
jgi:hypothetical protein